MFVSIKKLTIKIAAVVTAVILITWIAFGINHHCKKHKVKSDTNPKEGTPVPVTVTPVTDTVTGTPEVVVDEKVEEENKENSNNETIGGNQASESVNNPSSKTQSNNPIRPPLYLISETSTNSSSNFPSSLSSSSNPPHTIHTLPSSNSNSIINTLEEINNGIKKIETHINPKRSDNSGNSSTSDENLSLLINNLKYKNPLSISNKTIETLKELNNHYKKLIYDIAHFDDSSSSSSSNRTTDESYYNNNNNNNLSSHSKSESSSTTVTDNDDYTQSHSYSNSYDIPSIHHSMDT